MTAGAPALTELLVDLDAEHADLDDLVAGRPAADWDLPTPAEGWSVRDTVSHLAFFDEQARDASSRPDEFRAGLAQVWADPRGFIDAGPVRGRSMPAGEVLGWWREARGACTAAIAALSPTDRVPWYGPDMSPVSFATARLMETWAHGQDVADGLGVRRAPTARLRHVAHLGVRTRDFSFVAHARSVPPDPVRVELAAPDGTIWSWGPADAAERVTGPAIGFCLLVTQRRHRSDTGVVAHGPVATEWLSIAQAFAGPAGGGRQPGLPPA